MPDITKISARVLTADVAESGTDGDIYLGIAGREFKLASGSDDPLDLGSDDFQTGADFTYVLGEDANVRNAEYNDPRKPQLDTDDLDRYPAYIRFESAGDNPAWCLERVWVKVNPDSSIVHAFDNPRLRGTAEDRRIWLYNEGGKQLNLKRYDG